MCGSPSELSIKQGSKKVKSYQRDTMESTNKKLLDRVRDAIRLKHYSIRTEQAYVGWIKRYILFHGVRHPKEIGSGEIEASLPTWP